REPFPAPEVRVEVALDREPLPNKPSELERDQAAQHGPDCPSESEGQDNLSPQHDEHAQGQERQRSEFQPTVLTNDLDLIGIKDHARQKEASSQEQNPARDAAA